MNNTIFMIKNENVPTTVSTEIQETARPNAVIPEFHSQRSGNVEAERKMT